jgi:hypothetical protein
MNIRASSKASQMLPDKLREDSVYGTALPTARAAFNHCSNVLALDIYESIGVNAWGERVHKLLHLNWEEASLENRKFIICKHWIVVLSISGSFSSFFRQFWVTLNSEV